MDCTYPVAGSCAANAKRTCFNASHILSPGFDKPQFSNVLPVLGKSFSICASVSEVVFVGCTRHRSRSVWKRLFFSSSSSSLDDTSGPPPTFRLPRGVVTTNFDAQRDARVSAGKREEYRQSPPPPPPPSSSSSSSSPPTEASTPPSSAIVSGRERERERERDKRPIGILSNKNKRRIKRWEKKKGPSCMLRV